MGGGIIPIIYKETEVEMGALSWPSPVLRSDLTEVIVLLWSVFLLGQNLTTSLPAPASPLALAGAFAGGWMQPLTHFVPVFYQTNLTLTDNGSSSAQKPKEQILYYWIELTCKNN